MRRKSSLALLLLLLLAACAPKRPLVKPVPAVLPPPQPPPMTEKQLLGLRTPHGLVSDPDTGQYALKDVMEAYWAMKAEAARAGWRLILVSGYRSFYSQRRVWNNYDKPLLANSDLSQKARVRSIMSVVSVPGLSRHHWGTELDISEETLRGRLLKINKDTPKKVIDFYAWMEENAPRFGFCKVYLGIKGAVVDEPWHWSYFPFSKFYARQFMDIKDFKPIMDIKVDEVDYLMRNFPKILKRETQSTNPECAPEDYPEPTASIR
ncbi:MAG TPA: D-alanyl-D-alanine carboxypeptidase family protein [bacterium]|nr:D-alanyl-D-alanine carboxypeptidase family protein [bacterium]